MNPVEPVPQLGDKRSRRRRWWLLLLALLVIAVCLGGLSTYYVFGRSSTGVGAPNATRSVPMVTRTTAVTTPAFAPTTGPSGTQAPSTQAPPTAPGAVSPSAGGDGTFRNDQFIYQLDIVDQRSALKSGSVYADSLIRADTGHGYPVSVVICGLESPVCGRRAGSTPAPTAQPSGLPPALGPVSVGARIKAELVSGYQEVSVAGPQAAAVQPIIEATDSARWRWFVYAHEPNTYTLTLSISVLQTNSDELLIPSQTFDITLIATTTTKDKIAQAGAAVATFLTTTVVGLITTVATLVSTFGAVGNGVRRVWKRRRLAHTGTPAQPPSG